MKNLYKKVISRCYALFFLVSFNNVSSQTKVIAYVPNWINLNTFANTIQYSKLTHINIAFENPTSNGTLSFQSGNDAIIQTAHSNNVKVFVSLGGGSASEDANQRNIYFNLINSTNRTQFIQKILNYVNAHGFDGVDVDLEGPAINSDYAGFISALATALHTNNKQISAALSEGYGGANVPNSTFTSFDWINIMAYDGTGPWNPNEPGQHSSYTLATTALTYWKTTRGLPKVKAILGVPFYGYGFGAAYASNEYPYSQIVSSYPGAENLDQVGNTIWYNGIPTIKQKTTLALQDGGGIMIWQLSSDAIGPKSLLSAINEVINGSLGTRDIENNAAIAIFPNPVKERLTVSLGNETTANIAIISLNGSLLYKAKINNGTSIINIDDINYKGLCFLKITTDNGFKIFKTFFE
jgi:chitinase